MKVERLKIPSLHKLVKLGEEAQRELHKRRLKELREMDCDCDRYTCGRCQEIDYLRRYED